MRVLQVNPRFFLTKIRWCDCFSAELIIEGSSASRRGMLVCVCESVCTCGGEGGGGVGGFTSSYMGDPSCC